MAHTSLIDDLTATFKQLDELVERHLLAQHDQAIQDRLAYLHRLIEQFATELRELKQISSTYDQATGTTTGRELWQQTCTELRAREPTIFRTPAQALSAADLDLLHLVEYTGAAVALLSERRRQLQHL